jgi:tRNA(fMet)-specific endonuclease VapC
MLEWVSFRDLRALIGPSRGDRHASAEYGPIRAELERRGKPLGALDTLIAAHARSLGSILVTNNVREFKRVSDLVVENWVTATDG